MDERLHCASLVETIAGYLENCSSCGLPLAPRPLRVALRLLRGRHVWDSPVKDSPKHAAEAVRRPRVLQHEPVETDPAGVSPSEDQEHSKECEHRVHAR